MAYGAAAIIADKIKENDLYCPMIDARRMEVYTAIFDSKLIKIKDTEAVIIDEHSFSELRKNIIFISWETEPTNWGIFSQTTTVSV